MVYGYKVTNQNGQVEEGTIDAPTIDIAISSLQRRGFIIVYINPIEKKSFLQKNIGVFSRVSLKDIVVLSRQIATLFEANVSVLATFKLLSSESQNPLLRDHLREITDDIQGGIRISEAMAKHPKIFSAFYVNMIRAGEESGNLPQTLNYLADYLERSYELIQKAKNALIYPIFVVIVFIIVMILMLVLVIPQLSSILLEAGQDLPIYTRIVIGISDFFVSYGLALLVLIIIGSFFMWRYLLTRRGRVNFDRLKLSIPYIGDLYRKLYLARISDNIDTMLASGIPMVKTLEITGEVVGNEVYKDVLLSSAQAIRDGNSVTEAFGAHPEMPRIMTQMTKIGEETGKLGYVLKTIARFYKREVDAAVDTLVGLIEPLLIVFLGLGVGVMLASVLVPMYNITTAI